MASVNPPLIKSNYQQVLERIQQVAFQAGRDPQSIRLIVVTKGQPVEAVEAVRAAGATSLGENYVEEALAKIQACVGQPGIEWHMIGHVQSRKARQVGAHFDWVHSLDSLKLGRRLAQAAQDAGRVLPVLLECNVSGEESKFGWPAWQEVAWPALLADLAQLIELPGLQIRGLMTMAPFGDDPEEARPYFQKLGRLREFLAAQYPQVRWAELSMGMSADYEVAIQEGATMVRIGTAIMGPRPA